MEDGPELAMGHGPELASEILDPLDVFSLILIVNPASYFFVNILICFRLWNGLHLTLNALMSLNLKLCLLMAERISGKFCKNCLFAKMFLAYIFIHTIDK